MAIDISSAEKSYETNQIYLLHTFALLSAAFEVCHLKFSKIRF